MDTTLAQATARVHHALALEAMDAGDPEAMTALLAERAAAPHVPVREILRWRPAGPQPA